VSPEVERVDAIVVGARCAGSSASIALARAGRRVVVLDQARFPSDTLSTHLLFAGGVAELQAVGALARVEALGAPRLPFAQMVASGIEVLATYTPVDGIEYGMCVRRAGLDAALVETAREAGAEVRERARVTELVWEGERVSGVCYVDADDHRCELRAPLIIGADGRRSTVARLVDAVDPYRSNANQRACYFAYFFDGRSGSREVAAQWRDGRELGTAFPCDGGLVLVLLMPPVERAAAFRADLAGEFERTVERIPGLRARLEDCMRASKIRLATDTTSYFRRSSGPGWALPGDAGHFKDPITAQGIRDAVRFGRLLGEIAAPVLDDVARLDRATAAWEQRRERECLPSYQWTNQLARADSISPLEIELYRAAASRPQFAREVLDVFSRAREPSEVLTSRRQLGLIGAALVHAGSTPGGVLRAGAREARTQLQDRAERARLRSGARPMASWLGYARR
jgi:flavin-dependent dehydrogenase